MRTSTISKEVVAVLRSMAMVSGLVPLLLFAQSPVASTPLTVDTIIKRDLFPMVLETSGLLNDQGHLWTHNDRGGCNCLYAVENNARAKRKQWHLRGVDNLDWEDLASDGTYVYIADIGNNAVPLRSSLAIHRIPLDALRRGGPRANWENDDVVSSSVNCFFDLFTCSDRTEIETMTLSYHGTKATNDSIGNHNDFESLVVIGQDIFVFSKNWRGTKSSPNDHKTQIHTAPLSGFSSTAPVLLTKTADGISTKGLVTSADYDAATKQLVLVGTEQDTYRPFYMIFGNFPQNGFGTVLANAWLDMPCAQVEAVAWDGPKAFYMTNENDKGKKIKAGTCGELALPQLWRVELK